MTVLIIGSTGQVGAHLTEMMPHELFWGRVDVDLAQPETVFEAICAASPSLIINVAAYTAVDRAESEAGLAWRINAQSPAAMAMASSALNVPIIHLSTDYVFDGASNDAYAEDDGVRPINVYGRTKLAGELAISSLCSPYWILRTSWVFSEFGSNFAKTMIQLAEERDQLNIVDDQRGTPTYGGDLARVITALAEMISRSSAPAPGTYHVSGGRSVTWYEFGREVLTRAHTRQLITRVPAIQAVPTMEYPTPAARPLNSILKPSDAFLTRLGIPPDWEKGLDAMLTQMRSGSGPA